MKMTSWSEKTKNGGPKRPPSMRRTRQTLLREVEHLNAQPLLSGIALRHCSQGTTVAEVQLRRGFSSAKAGSPIRELAQS